MSLGKGIFIVSAKRTPFCKYGGSLRQTPASHAFAAAARDALRSAKVDPELVDQTVVGNLNYLSQCDGGKTPRYCGLYSGVPIGKPALGVSKACGTGVQALITAAVDMIFGTSNICLTGGTEIVSTLPMLVRNVRFGTALSTPYVFEDHIKTDLVDSQSGLSLSQVAEQDAKRYKISREDADEFKLNSHLRWKRAMESKSLTDEITTMTATLKNKDVEVDRDELSDVNASKAALGKLAPVFKDGVVTSGNSAAPADGAAAVVVASEDAIIRHNLTPLARVVAWSSVGVGLEDTGIAAAPAIRRLLKEQTLTVTDVDFFEINETFATQVLAISQELGIDIQNVNVNGGALAGGNPVAATGARMVTTVVHEMRRRKAKRTIVASSCGGGQGVAVMLETV